MNDLLGKRILVIDDNDELLQLIARVFSRTGARLVTASQGQDGLRKLFALRPDLVLLDLMMPDMDGWTVCRQIRHFSDVPVIMLTVLDRDDDVIRALDCGADYYVTKPFDVSVLLARARAALRRALPSGNGRTAIVYTDDDLTVYLHRHQALVRGEPVELTSTEHRLLLYLVENACRVLTVRQILRDVWQEASADQVEYVHTYVWRLRQKLEQDPGHPRYLLTEHGVGYSFQYQDPWPQEALGVGSLQLAESLN